VLLQAQADLLQLPVEVFEVPDATALGVAALARLGAGEASSVTEAVGPAEAETVIEPRMGAAEAAERLGAFEAGLQAVLAASR
jgi:glycerol kinase